MSYKIAGIDVHKKVLMVVVMDAHAPADEPERRRFATWLREREVKRSGHGIYCPILAIGVVGIGTVHALAVGTNVFQPCSAGSQARLQGRRTVGAAADRRRVDPEFVPQGEQRTWRNMTGMKTQLTRDRVRLQSQMVFAGGDAHQAVQCGQ
jgi:hypothetical protein